MQYDIAFLGGGPAGYQGAIRAAQLGAKAAVIEQSYVGGVCLNRGCIPTKTIRASAEAGRFMRRAKEFGFAPVDVLPDMAAIIARKQRVINMLRNSIEGLFRANRIDLIEGKGVLTDPNTIEIHPSGEQIGAAKIVIATGSRPAALSVFPKHPKIFLPDDIHDISYLPKQMLVVGAGAVGVEMAAIFNELGSQITLIEALDRILPNEDKEMGGVLLTVFKRRKIKVLCGVGIQSVTEAGENFIVRLSDGTELKPDTILQAVGRRFNTEGIGLKEIGVAADDKGRIPVNEHLQSNIGNIYAAGDAIGGWLLAHVAFAEGICAAEHASGQESKMDYRVIPRCVFGIPEYASVGISEEEAAARFPIKTGRFPFKSLGMSLAMGEIEGLVKIITHAETDQILGAHIIGAHGADLISELALAMKAKMPSGMIMETVHTHPTISEAVLEVVQELHGKAIHIPSKG